MKHMLSLIIVIILIAVTLPVRAAQAASVVYVKSNASGANNGTSWINAYTDLRTALINSPAGTELWVAAGTYKPTSGTDRTLYFSLKQGMSLYGGFVGTETSRDMRDWNANPTILSGEIGSVTTLHDNSQHILYASNLGLASSEIIDGFVVKDAWNDLTIIPENEGAGIFVYYSNVVLANMKFLNNRAPYTGGGAGCDTNEFSSSSPLAKMTIINSVFDANSAAYGAGISYRGSCAGIISNTNVLRNDATAGNTGIREYSSGANPSQVLIHNSIVWNNTVNGVQAPQIGSSGGTQVTYSDIQGGFAGTGNINADPQFVDANGADNIDGTLDDNLTVSATSPVRNHGSNGAISQDLTDMNGNGNFTEPIPWSMDKKARIQESIVDMGAFEYEAGSTVSFTGSTSPVNEGNFVTLTVGLSSPSSQTVTVHYATADGSARAGLDYTAASGTLTFSPDTTSMTIIVNTLDNLIVDAGRTFNVSLSGPTNTILGSSSISVTINNIDTYPSVNLSGATSIAEGGQATLTVSLSKTWFQDITVNWTTRDSSALAGLNYTAASGTLTFSPGETTKTISVTTSRDNLVTGDKLFTVTLSNLSANAVMGSSSAAVTVINTDIATTVGFAQVDFQIVEGGTALIKVRLNQTSTSTVRVTYVTSGDTAVAGVDYTDITGMLIFSPGQTEKTFGVPTVNDDLQNGNRTVWLELTSPSGAALVTGESRLTINDNDTDTAFSTTIQMVVPNTAYRLARGEISVDIAGMAKNGTIAVAETTAPEGAPAIPSNFKSAGTFFEVNLTDDSGLKIGFQKATVCFPYLDSAWQSLGIAENQLKLLHWNGTIWEDVTKYQDIVNKQLCGEAASFSPFLIAGGGSGATGNAVLIINPGSLSVVGKAINFGPISLNGAEQVATGTTSAWPVVDATGSGSGWTVSVRANDFIDGSGHSISVNGLSVQLLDANIVRIDGGPKPHSTVPVSSPIATSQVVIASAPKGTGMGTYTLTPVFTLIVPPSTYVGRYSSVVTVTSTAVP